MKTHVEFRSTAFPPYEGEEDEINPGRYGKRVAELLIGGLNRRGFKAFQPHPQDWGWRVEIENDGFPLWIGVGNYEEYPDGFLCFIEPHKPTIRKVLFFGKINTSRRVAALQKAIDEVLSAEPTINSIRWWTYDEFHRPGSA
jgi:hypothetical protein